MPRNKIRMAAAIATLTGAGMIAGAAHASSEDAWQAFAADVEAKCLSAAEASVEFPHAAVDPFGSAHFGMALITGKPKGANGFVSYFCIYDKQTKTVELGSEIRTDEIRLAPEE